MKGSSKKVWWKCPEVDDHEWEAEPKRRKQYGCPCCAGHKVVKSNCLKTTDPDIAAQWHPTKNGDLKTTDITRGSTKNIWWKC